jgi:hypothetical protein
VASQPDPPSFVLKERSIDWDFEAVLVSCRNDYAIARTI